MVRKSIYLAAALLLVAVVVPNVSSARTAEEEGAGVVYSSPGASIPVQGSGAGFCYDFKVDLKIGDEGGGVLALHNVLTKEGVGGIFNKSGKGLFDEATASGVTGFQQKYRSEILEPIGLKFGTGYVGSRTRAKLNALYGCSGRSTASSSITVISPNGGEVWKPQFPDVGYDATQIVQWRYVNGNFVEGTLYRTSGGPVRRYPTCTMGIPAVCFDKSLGFGGPASAGQATVSLPYDIIPANDYQVRLSLEDMNDGYAVVATAESAAPFSITAAGSGNSSQPSVNVLSPNGGEKLTIGKEYEIKWDYNSLGVAEDGIYDKRISLIRDKGGDVGPPYCDVGECTRSSLIYIAGGWGPPGPPFNLSSKSLKWLVPSYIVPGDDYRIGIGFSISEVRHADSMSSAPFSIVSGTSGNQPPVISGVSGPTNLRVGETGTWTVNARDPQGGTLSYFIDWGEVMPVPPVKPPARVFSQTATFTHSYSRADTYTVRATVLNDKGLSAETSISVQVGEVPAPQPSLALFTDPQTPVGREVQQGEIDVPFLSAAFVTNMISDVTVTGIGFDVWSQGSGTILSSDMSLWDGNTLLARTSSSQTFSVNLTIPRNTTKTLTIKGSVSPAAPIGGRTALDLHSFLVRVGSPSGTVVTGSASGNTFTVVSRTGGNQPPVISGVSGPTNLRVGETGTWTVNARDPQGGPLAYTVTWGDEVPTEVPPMAPFYPLSQMVTFTHLYAQPGTYTPSFIVVNSAGLSAMTGISVQVGEVPAPRASLTLATDPQTPLGRDIRPGEIDVPLLSAAFTAGTASDVTITGILRSELVSMDVYFQWSPTMLSDVSLWDGNTLLARTPLVNPTPIFPIFSVNLTIPRNTTKTLTIKGSVSPAARAGDRAALYLDGDSVRIGSPSGTVVTGSASGNTFSIVPPLGQMTLTVSRTGGGTGTVTSVPVGIDCGTTCAANFAQGSTVTLTAAPAAGSRFTGWTGDCMGMNPTPTCTLSMTANRTAGASFVLSQQETRASLTIATDPQTPPGRDIQRGEIDVPLLSAAFTAGTASDVTITGIDVSFDSREGRDIVLPSDMSLWDGNTLLARTPIVTGSRTTPVLSPIFSVNLTIPRGTTKMLTVKGSVSPAAPVGGDVRLYLYSYLVGIGSPSGTAVTGSAYGNTFTVVSRQAPQPPVISGVSGPTNLRVGETGTWTVTASDPQRGPLTYAVTWGDEEWVPSPMTPLSSLSQTVTIPHTYNRPGTYAPSFIVVNSAGLSARTSITVNVGTPTPLPPLSLTAALTAPLMSAVIDSFPSTERTIAQFALRASGEAIDVSSLTFQSGDSVGLGRLQLRNMRIEVARGIVPPGDNRIIIPSFGGRSPEEVDRRCAVSCTFSDLPFRIADGDVAIINVIAEVVSASRGARYAQPFTMTWARGEGAVTRREVTLSGGVKGPDFMVEDRTPPTVSVSHSPASPLASDVVDITATASDESGIYRIDIYVDGDVIAKTCYGVTSCTYSSGFTVGAHTYYATATDASVNLNVGRDPASGTKSFRVPREPRERIGPPYTQ